MEISQDVLSIIIREEEYDLRGSSREDRKYQKIW